MLYEVITKSKDDSTHSRRVVFSYLQDKDAVTELFREVSPKIGDRPGGYTRILKTGARLGDNADMCIIELVDYNENLLAAKQESEDKSGVITSYSIHYTKLYEVQRWCFLGLILWNLPNCKRKLHRVFWVYSICSPEGHSHRHP